MDRLPDSSLLKTVLLGAEMAARRLEPYVAGPFCGTLWEIMDAVILLRLAEHNGNKTRAAKSLGIDVKTIHNRLGRIHEGTSGSSMSPKEDEGDYGFHGQVPSFVSRI